jgi:uncharacterized protein Usg
MHADRGEQLSVRPLMWNEALEPPLHMVKLTQERQIRSYPWVHPDEER